MWTSEDGKTKKKSDFILDFEAVQMLHVFRSLFACLGDLRCLRVLLPF